MSETPAPAPTAEPTGPSPARRRTFAFVLAAGVVAVALGAAVFVVHARLSRVRWFAHRLMAQLDCSHPDICRLPPSRHLSEPDATGHAYGVDSNSVGFRGPERSEVRADPRTLRVAIFGDSFVYGIGVEEPDTLSHQLERALSEAFPGRPVEVMNFGLPMNFLGSSFVAYRDFARRYTPDVAVFALFEDRGLSPNDINERIRRIKASSVMTTLLTTDVGREVVNDWQVVTMELFSKDAELERLRGLGAALAEDQRDRGLVVVAFSFVGTGAYFVDALPPGTRVVNVPSEFTQAAYAAGPYCLPGDGHPNPAGTAYFAARLAAGIVPATTLR